MGKNRRGDKERSREQELKHENHTLRRQISSLRKQLARLDLDRYGTVRDIVQEHYANEEVDTNTQDMMESLKNTWKCYKCNEGHLEIQQYSKLSDPWYFRQCNNCPNRTKSQIYTPSVKGIVKTVQEKLGFKKK